MAELEDWKLDFEWLRVRHYIKEQMQRPQLPDLNAILFLIGLQELGQVKRKFTKEQKQDLMHIAVCRLLSYDGHYEFEGLDADGWPHWKALNPIDVKGPKEQERLLKVNIIRYFSPLLENN